MLGRLRKDWKKPEGTRWHHFRNGQGKLELQLVDADLHNPTIAHDGPLKGIPSSSNKGGLGPRGRQVLNKARTFMRSNMGKTNVVVNVLPIVPGTANELSRAANLRNSNPEKYSGIGGFLRSWVDASQQIRREGEQITY